MTTVQSLVKQVRTDLETAPRPGTVKDAPSVKDAPLVKDAPKVSRAIC